MPKINRKVCVAPMMDCTDRHDRYFLRLISKNVMLYSEMISTGAILKGNQKNVLESWQLFSAFHYLPFASQQINRQTLRWIRLTSMCHQKKSQTIFPI